MWTSVHVAVPNTLIPSRTSPQQIPPPSPRCSRNRKIISARYFPSACFLIGLFSHSWIKARGWEPCGVTRAPWPVSHLTSDLQDYSTIFFRLSCLRLVSVMLTQQNRALFPPPRSRPIRFTSGPPFCASQVASWPPSGAASLNWFPMKHQRCT